MATRPRRKKVVRPSAGPSGVQLGEVNARDMILQGAAGVFAERGIRAASVEDILKASRVSRRTFYRFYQSKEDVMVALYSLGTEVLLVGCRFAMEHETDALQQVLQGFEVHLRNARDVGRLVFVLGGEAHRQESPLHARRMHVHAELVGLFVTGAERSGQRADPLLYRALILALEGVTRFVLEECDEGRAVTDAGIDKARQVMARLAISAVGGNGPGATPGPQPPRRQRASRPPR